MCVCESLYVRVFMCVCVWGIRVHAHVRMCVSACMRVCLYELVNIYICAYVCMHICMHAYMHVHASKRVRARVYLKSNTTVRISSYEVFVIMLL